MKQIFTLAMCILYISFIKTEGTQAQVYHPSQLRQSPYETVQQFADRQAWVVNAYNEQQRRISLINQQIAAETEMQRQREVAFENQRIGKLVDKSPIKNKSVVEVAYRNKSAIEELSAQVEVSEADLLKELDDAIKTIRSFDTEGEKLTLSALKKVVAGFVEDVGSLIDTYKSFKSTTGSYSKLLSKSGPYFYEASSTFRKAAEAEKYDDIKETYLAMADVFEKLEQKMEKRSKAIEPAVGQIDQAIDYIKRTQILLERLNAILGPVPEDSVAVEAMLSRILQYQARFEKLQDAMKRFKSAMHEKPPTT